MRPVSEARVGTAKNNVGAIKKYIYIQGFVKTLYINTLELVCAFINCLNPYSES